MGPEFEPARSIAVAAAVTPALEALASAEALPAIVTGRQHPLEYGESALLGIIEALVERIDGVGDLLQGGAGLRHCGRPPMHAIGRIVGLRRSVAARIHGRGDAVEAQLRHLARGLLEGRAVLLLVPGQSQARMQ